MPSVSFQSTSEITFISVKSVLSKYPNGTWNKLKKTRCNSYPGCPRNERDFFYFALKIWNLSGIFSRRERNLITTTDVAWYLRVRIIKNSACHYFNNFYKSGPRGTTGNYIARCCITQFFNLAGFCILGQIFKTQNLILIHSWLT